MAPDYKDIGVVRSIFQYPVKGMSGTSLQEGSVGWHGLRGDRRFAFLRSSDRSGLPWVSPREVPDLIKYSARWEDPLNENSKVVITTPTGVQLDLLDLLLTKEISDLCGEPIQVVKLWRGTFDSMDLSVISTNSLASIETLLGIRLDPARFRPNFLVEASGERAYPEDRWLGNSLRFGQRDDSATVRIDRKTIRCTVVNAALGDEPENREILRTIASARKNRLGVYGSTRRPGTVAVGDPIGMRVG